MTTPYDGAITALKQEMSSLASAIRILERKRDEYEAGGQLSMSISTDWTPDLASANAADDGPTNEEAVDTILERAYPKGLGVSDIVKHGPIIGGRTLNKNSVRWVLKHGVDGGRYVKRKEKGRAWYSMKR